MKHQLAYGQMNRNLSTFSILAIVPARYVPGVRPPHSVKFLKHTIITTNEKTLPECWKGKDHKHFEYQCDIAITEIIANLFNFKKQNKSGTVFHSLPSQILGSSTIILISSDCRFIVLISSDFRFHLKISNFLLHLQMKIYKFPEFFSRILRVRHCVQIEHPDPLLA